MSTRDKLTDEVIFAAVRAGGLYLHAEATADIEAIRAVLLGALEPQRPADCTCAMDSTEPREHAHDCDYYMRMMPAPTPERTEPAS